MRHLTIQLNMVCTKEEKSRLVAMARRAKCSAAEVVRRAMNREFDHLVSVALAEEKAGKLSDIDRTAIRLLLDFCKIT